MSSKKLKVSQRKSGSKKMGAVDVDLHEETEVFTTRDGHKKQVTTEEKKRLEWLKKNHEIDEKANVKPPAPSKPFIVKRALIGCQLQLIGDRLVNSAIQVKSSMHFFVGIMQKRKSLSFMKMNLKRTLESHYMLTRQKKLKKIVNKKAKYITVFNLVPGQRYEFRVRFMYDKSVTSGGLKSHNDGIEGLESFPTEVHLPMRILFCTKCAATLLWGLEVSRDSPRFAPGISAFSRLI